MKQQVIKSLVCVKRYSDNPVLTNKDVPYDSTLVFNAGVIKWGNGYAVVFRNDYGGSIEGFLAGRRFKGTNIGLAFSDDGLHWKVEREPVFNLHDDEILRAYDPRLTVIDNEVYMTFAVDTKHGLCGGIAHTTDLHHFEVISISAPDNRNMVLFPEKINGMYMRLERPMPVYSRGRNDRFDIWISESPDLIYWGKSCLLAAVEDFPFANDKIGPGAPPIRTDKGWLVFMHAVYRDESRGKNGWEDKWTKIYYAGVMLLDIDDPHKILGICREPLIAPETIYETEEGFRTYVVFPTAAILEGETVKIYYGASDTVIALAMANVNDLINACIVGGPRLM